MIPTRSLRPFLIALLLALVPATPAHAVLDVEDKGPVLEAGNFRMRVTNIGVLGNPYYDAGRSSDPSFEFPAYSGIELLNHAELWVGAVDEDGSHRVSGGPMLEWRPTLDPADHVQLRRRSDLGSRRGYDDDGDGRVDEEILNGVDDDGDGFVDEDLGLFADQDAGCRFVDDRPEAVNYGYPTGESHVPLGLTVDQTASAWSFPGYETMCAVHYVVTNHGTKHLRDLYCGVLADLDVRRLSQVAGHRDDRIARVGYSASTYEGLSRVTSNAVRPSIITCSRPPCPPVPCFTNFGATLPAVVDGDANSGLPAIVLMPLSHTLDPISRVDPNVGRAPYAPSWHSNAFLEEGVPGEGGVPALDPDRYEALAGLYPGASTDRTGDWATLVSCGPFRALDPGQSIEFTVALVAATKLDSLSDAMARAALMEHGGFYDLLPNETTHPDSTAWNLRISGISGHEVCVDPPEGTALFVPDIDCVSKFDGLIRETFGIFPEPRTVTHGHCVWADLDCSECTGLNGRETRVPWYDPGEVPPGPSIRVTPGDHQVTIEWDNRPELLIDAGRVGGPSSRFTGYRLFKLGRWKDRESLLPPGTNWQQVAGFGVDTLNGERPLATAIDSTVDYERILFERKYYPVGRYRFVDRDVLDGFDYVYAVTTEADMAIPAGDSTRATFNYLHLQSPLIARFDQRVTPYASSRNAGNQVTVVPNPFRGGASWDRPPVFGDPLPRHVDFMHLPKAVATIKIFTLAGDFVAQIVHDGTSGNGEASWDLISRNGQEVESGVYLFAVDSPLGHQVGKFVIVR